MCFRLRWSSLDLVIMHNVKYKHTAGDNDRQARVKALVRIAGDCVVEIKNKNYLEKYRKIAQSRLYEFLTLTGLLQTRNKHKNLKFIVMSKSEKRLKINIFEKKN